MTYIISNIILKIFMNCVKNIQIPLFIRVFGYFELVYIITVHKINISP